jgi:hypothetical protein
VYPVNYIQELNVIEAILSPSMLAASANKLNETVTNRW